MTKRFIFFVYSNFFRKIRPFRQLLSKLIHALGKAKYTIHGVNYYLNPTSTIENNIISTKYHDKHIIDLMNENLKKNDFFIDIGANIGYFSLYASIIKNAHVIAFEPSSRELKDLYFNIYANLPLSTQINVYPFALGYKHEKCTLHINHIENPGKNSLLKRHRSNSTETIEVYRGDMLIPESCYEKIKLVKIDVEGAEYKVLLGIKSMLSHITDAYLVIEITPFLLEDAGDSVSAIYDLLENLDFLPLTGQREEGLVQYDEIFYHK